MDHVGLAQAELVDARPDIILLDIDMPGRDGWHFARALRNGDYPATPIIMISGHAHEEGLHRNELGIHDAFFTKPFYLEDLTR